MLSMLTISREMLSDALPELSSSRIKSLSTYDLICQTNLLVYPSAGVPVYTPFGQRVFDKMSQVIHSSAQRHGLSKLSLPVLQAAQLFERSGRYEDFGDGIYRTHNNSYILSPTSEEQIISFLSKRIRSYRSLPLHLYQIKPLFRNNQAHGVTRNKEFITFESYSFHINKENLIADFKLYDDLFKSILDTFKIDYFKHNKYEESHYIDYLFETKNGEYNVPKSKPQLDQQCDLNSTVRASSICMGMIVKPSISETFRLRVDTAHSGLQSLHVGTFGLGLLRAITAIVEQKRDEYGLRLPPCLQPYAAVFIPESIKHAVHYNEFLSFALTRGDIVVDNRKCDRVYKIRYAFFIGVERVIYITRSNGVLTYHVVYRSGESEEFSNLTSLNTALSEGATASVFA
jgi:prolyl-tRNA synthetase